MGHIIQLGEHTINQIAAGEVVECPASVVKELAENALDAKAGRIFVSLKKGGHDLIEVLDDGVGMDEKDAMLSIKRHATSKLQVASGLHQVTTMGFRGEALASIAAVSRMDLLTCSDELEGGIRIWIEGNGQPKVTHEGFPRGCKVRVEALFYNTPARRKFLRSAPAELRRIQDSLVNLALPHWRVHFRLTHHDRMLIDWPRASSLGERVLQVFGKKVRQKLLAIELQDGSVHASGLVSHPTYPEASRRLQHLFINQRAVRSIGVRYSIEQAYRTLRMPGRYPAYILLLNLPNEDVDVNVHPTKLEVRLRNIELVKSVLTTEIHRQVEYTVRQQALTMTDAEAKPNQPFQDVATAQFPTTQTPLNHALHTLPIRVNPPNSPATNRTPHPWNNDTFDFQPIISPSAQHSTEPFTNDNAPTISPSKSQDAPLLDGLSQPQAQIAVNRTLIPLCQFHLTYIIAQRGTTLLLIDQHAAHERIVFEALRTQLYGKGVQTQLLLEPINIDLSPQNAMLLEQHLLQFQKMGFAFEIFGPNSFVLRETPSVFGTKNVESLVLETLDELAIFGKSGKVEEALNDILERTACHSAIRAGDRLSLDTIQALLDQLECLDISLFCPHGRPVWVEIGVHELEKRFKRIP